ncbi:hypothetical protein DOK78_001521 [Enterococcus sp. DIV2402]|uniref:Uncharacterized protein n=1 Tax=Candidatus Enterococcus lowellii TaxID=2230877 RepID=A0ABZ2SRV1_9ENTE|nr:CDP-glycerol glycerophosphotransferase family protein [Enterococcus sp. DIV2402]MBO0464290.1 CDP-glycerol glycerophosphotransferase family protein [Enterococcus sp. DIV2402]
MKIGIVGYHLFGLGGTSRANINLLQELFDIPDVEVVYYNTKKYNQRIINEFENREEVFKEYHGRLTYRHFSEILKDSECDVYLLTRENLFILSKLLKKKFPNALIVGEVHAPVANIEPEIDLCAESIDVYRVATDINRRMLLNRVNEVKGEIVEFPVSVRHLEYDKNVVFQGGVTKNLYIYSRFEELQKDISYSIALMDYLVHYLGEDEYKLYINGKGKTETLYHNLIAYYNLEDNVFINEKIPEDALYLSTARTETFGYSISEAFVSGKKVLLYGGDDHVLTKIYGNFKTFGWLTKNIESDCEVLLSYCNQTISQEDFEADLDEALVYSIKRDYGQKFIDHLLLNKNILIYTGEAEETEIFEKIYNWDKSTRTSKLSTAYNWLNTFPGFKQLFRNKWLHKQLVDIYDKIFPYTEELDVREDFAFIESYHGKSFSGDPKYIALELKKMYPNMYIYISSINSLVDMEILKWGFLPVRLGSREYVRKFRQSKYIITNGNALDKCGKSDEQVFIQTWHGLPLKKMVNDLENPDQRREESEAFLPRMLKWDYLLSCSERNTEYFSSAFMLDQNENLQILEYGAPRNAYLIKNANNKKELERVHFKYFNRPYNGDTYILYCPTWRKDKRNSTTSLDLQQFIEELPENYQLIVKLHPLEGHLRKQYNSLHPRIHCFYNELVDIQELYILSKVMITDYSSAMFDYAHMNRKILIFQEDAEDYGSQIGYYFNTKELIDIDGHNYSLPELVEEILQPYDGYYNRLIIQELMTEDNKNATKDILSTIIEESKVEHEMLVESL